MSTSRKTGRDYLRVSYDGSGTLRSPDEQHAENAASCAQAAIELVDGSYRESAAVSASRYGTKKRDDWDRLLGDLEAGQFAADVLVLWESSRGSRKVGEWVRLVDACEASGVHIYVTTHEREYNLAVGRDRKTLLEDAVAAEYEVSQTRDRVKRNLAANAAAGRPHGTPPFGYRRIYDDRTGRLVEQVPDEAEAPVVRELYARLKKGDALHAIARDLAERGVTTRSGVRFGPQHLRDMALRAAYAGIRVHDTTGATTGHGRRLDGSVEAQWEPLVEPETYYAVRAMLTSPDRTTRRPGRAHYLLSMIAVCDVCDAVLVVKRHHGHLAYSCRAASHVIVRMVDLDAYVEETMLVYLGQPAARERWARDADDAELAALHRELEAQRLALAEAEREVPADVHEARQFAQLARNAAARVAELEDQERQLATPPALRDMLGPGGDLRTRWAGASVSARREVARLLLAPDLLGQVRVVPAGRRGVPAAQRVVWVTDTT